VEEFRSLGVEEWRSLGVEEFRSLGEFGHFEQPVFVG
jgi:hypothetical protein